MAEMGVSVIIPAFNGAHYIGAALASVREQSVQPSEVLVVDAGSTDGTPDLVLMLGTFYPAVRLIQSKSRLSAPEARNKALAQVANPIVATLDQDDLMVPTRLERQMAVLAASPDLAAVGGRLQRVDELGLPIKDPVGNGRAFPLSPETIRWTLPTSMPTFSSSLTFRTAALREIGGFREDRPLTDDYALLARLADSGSVANLDERVGHYRVHSDQASAEHRRRQAHESHLTSWRLFREQSSLAPSMAHIGCLAHPTLCRDAKLLAEAAEILLAFRDETLGCRPLSVADRAWITADADVLGGQLEEARASLQVI